jgi:hypothetical protein
MIIKIIIIFFIFNQKIINLLKNRVFGGVEGGALKQRKTRVFRVFDPFFGVFDPFSGPGGRL